MAFPIATSKELLAERGVEVDHVTVYRCVQRFTPLLADAACFCRRSPGDRWFVDETYVKVGGVWRYGYRAVDQHERPTQRRGIAAQRAAVGVRSAQMDAVQSGSDTRVAPNPLPRLNRTRV
jgi:DDE domain